MPLNRVKATSRARQIDKIKLEEVKASSRQNPFIRFEQDKKLFRNALEVEALTKGFDNGPLFKNVNLLLEVGGEAGGTRHQWRG
ncbi:heme ABC transporter ATP-binding protein [Salmonella enterica subsp. enterica]|uniref:Heme ABC transporter ATP-binding protein n=1 Tax=Salmonella enterica I TaxID=59201 RepID=A0A447MVJ1_SALET|nr:heme ABC transporter ATP-binding protein [Salmonella enterica subsp. enterica]